MGTTTSFNRQQRRVLAILSAIFIIVNFGAMMEDAPMTVIFQDILCKKYYKDAARAGNTTDAPAVPLFAAVAFDCKVEPIQTELAFIIGWRNTIEMIAGGCCSNGIVDNADVIPFLRDLRGNAIRNPR